MMRRDIWGRHDHEAREWAQLAFPESRARGRARTGARSILFALAVVLAFVAALLYAECAAAQEFECPETGGHTAPRGATLTHDGESGRWFRGDVARCLLGYVEELRIQRGSIGLLQERLTLRDEQLDAVREAVALSIQAEERATGVLEAAMRRARTADEDARRERDLRWVWVVGAVVVVLALEAVAVWAFSQLQL